MARIKAFTLAEFFTLAAVVAVIGAVLSPITAAAKQTKGTATTVSNLRVIGLAAIAYANDYDDQVVQSQLGPTDSTHYWPVTLTPYVPSRSYFFDPTRPIPTGNVLPVPGTSMPWYDLTNLSINEGGYTSHYVTLGGTCGGRRISYVYGGRSLGAMTEPNKRVAFSPTTYGGTLLGWSRFLGYQSNIIDSSVLSTKFSYNNMVWNTNTLYANNQIPVVHADGSAGALSRADFKTKAEVPTIPAYCAWMSTEGQRTWGPYWLTS